MKEDGVTEDWTQTLDIIRFFKGREVSIDDDSPTR